MKTISNDLLEQYNKTHEEKLHYILSAIGSDTWSFQKSVANIQLFFRSISDSALIETKTVVVMDTPAQAMIDVMTYGKVFTLKETPQGPIPPQEIFSVYENHDEHSSIIYFMAMEPPAFLVAPREFLLYRRTYEIDGKTIFMQMSIENEELKPQRDSFVRGIIMGQAFVIEKDPENDEKSIMTVFSHVNPGGRLPSFAVNFSVKNQIDGIQTITAEAAKYWKKEHPDK